MYKKIVSLILVGMLLYLPGCGGRKKSPTKSFVRQDVNLALIQTVAVLPFEGGGRAQRIREFTITQLLAADIYDVVDKGKVDVILAQEAITPGMPLDSFTIRRLGETLNVEAVLLGSVEIANESRGNAAFPQIIITMRLINCETGLLLWQASGRGSGYSLADRLFNLGQLNFQGFQMLNNNCSSQVSGWSYNSMCFICEFLPLAIVVELFDVCHTWLRTSKKCLNHLHYK